MRNMRRCSSSRSASENTDGGRSRAEVSRSTSRVLYWSVQDRARRQPITQVGAMSGRTRNGEIEIPDRFPVGGDVREKRVVLTGAGRGLGQLLAHAFSDAGPLVALVARTESDLEKVAAELPGESLVFPGDVRDADFNEAVADG